jgi:hypothetical protein
MIEKVTKKWSKKFKKNDRKSSQKHERKSIQKNDTKIMVFEAFSNPPGRSWVVSFRVEPGSNLGRTWVDPGSNLGGPHPGSILGRTWVEPGSNLGRTWVVFLGRPWVDPGSNLGRTWVEPGSNLGRTWVEPGSNLGRRPCFGSWFWLFRSIFFVFIFLSFLGPNRPRFFSPGPGFLGPSSLAPIQLLVWVGLTRKQAHGCGSSAGAAKRDPREVLGKSVWPEEEYPRKKVVSGHITSVRQQTTISLTSSAKFFLFINFDAGWRGKVVFQKTAQGGS